mgnify:FL=1
MEWNYYEDTTISKFRVPNKDSKIVREGETTGPSVKESVMKVIPPNYLVGKFATLVADILNEEYGEHNFEKFLKVLRSEIKLEKKGRSAFTSRD